MTVPTTYRYQWNRNSIPISGATSATYTAQGADLGDALTCAVTATNSAGSTSVTTEALSVSAGMLAVTHSYAATTAILPNPEQGFYIYTETHYQPDNSGYVPLSSSTMAGYRTSTFTEDGLTFGPTSLVFRYFYMEKYVGGQAIDQAYLDLVAADLAAVRVAGCKIILRFAYQSILNSTRPYNDAPVTADIVAHIDQLYPVLNTYADVITAVQAGFIGVFGEWYYTDNFASDADPNVLSVTDWANRTDVLDALVTNLDPRMFVLVRYLGIKQFIYGMTPTDPDAARVGFHDDAFEAPFADYGTYTTFSTQTVAQNIGYLSAQTSLPLTGESADYNPPQSDWNQASSDLARYRWTALNPSYYPETLQAWGQSNIDTVSRNLGARLQLISVKIIPSTALPASNLNVTVSLTNVGFAAPFRNRPVYIVLVDGVQASSTSASVDVRTWAPGSVIDFSVSIVAPPRGGTYEVYMSLPDPSPILANNPKYAFALANTDVWKAETGLNDLLVAATSTGAAFTAISSA